ncbi:MAG: hypothetical protein J6D03_00080 [Clostridia bacterium]|nr:hypothetical protein [Clostridia bacterium]
MSGSIGANRIPTRLVKSTVEDYINKVLKGFLGYVCTTTTGSYNVMVAKGIEKSEGHGDIDLVVYIRHDNLKQLKKEFKAYCESLPDDVTIRFRDGKRKGDKAQLFGAIVTVGFPIYNEKDKYVQIDNIIVNSEDDMIFQKSFLDMNAQKQALFQGLVRVLLQHEDRFEICKHFRLFNLSNPESNQEYEFVLSVSGLSLRLITLTSDRREDIKKRIEVWRSNKWADVEWLMRDYNFNSEYEDILNIVADRITDERSRSRIVGIIKSMIHVGPGEIGTIKGKSKENAIKLAEYILK